MHGFADGFSLQAATEPTPAVPVPDVAAVITVDAEALVGPGLAHVAQLLEGSMMADFVALFEGLSLAPATAVVQGGDASVGGVASVPEEELPIPGPPSNRLQLPHQNHLSGNHQWCHLGECKCHGEAAQADVTFSACPTRLSSTRIGQFL